MTAMGLGAGGMGEVHRGAEPPASIARVIDGLNLLVLSLVARCPSSP